MMKKNREQIKPSDEWTQEEKAEFNSFNTNVNMHYMKNGKDLSCVDISVHNLDVTNEVSVQMFRDWFDEFVKDNTSSLV